MTLGRVISSVAACAAVAGCAVAAISVARQENRPVAERSTVVPTPTRTYRLALVPSTASPIPSPTTSARASRVTPHVRTRVPAPGTAPSTATVTAATRAAVVPARVPPRTSAPPVVRHVTPAPRPSSSHAVPKPAGTRLPLGYSTGTATRVITVIGGSRSGTTAALQAWTKTSGGWTKWGPAIGAHVGSDGLGNASEYRSATPTGSFTLTQAFGYYGDPGTGLPYFKTTWADWWISTPGPYYNTHQSCSSCGYRSPDEHLVTETPYYNYAVVIDTPSGASAYPQGSAFFLHVTDGRPTAGCVAIPQSNLVAILRWLTPSAHPRILIGVA